MITLERFNNVYLESLMLAEKFLLWLIERVKYWCSEGAKSYIDAAVENLISAYERCYNDDILTEAITTLLVSLAL